MSFRPNNSRIGQTGRGLEERPMALDVNESFRSTEVPLTLIEPM